ncbi:metal ABC transporter substrate-binding protein [Arthrobacter zhaoguopingii]|uniref:metal ABC transporter substrate-binding protein n=1 Tax=Arthrobacter zhaoguopingii TaxID=2681491 RepID=UPI001357A8F3|nr:metal ABC transporter substrate-binding protein [Arthrobacter zhaoguopingii]
MISLPRRALVLPVLAALALSACAPPEPAGTNGDTASLTVLTSFYPLHYIAEQVGGEEAEVSSVTPPGADPHNLELSPAKVAELADASVVVYASGFQAAVDEAVEQTSPKQTIDVADAADLSPAAGRGGNSAAKDGTGGSRDAGGADPHFWLDPQRLAAVAGVAARRFSEIDPQNADVYKANAQELGQELASLDVQFTTGLADCERRTIVVAHEAYGYLADRYDLEQIGISGIDPESEPAPARIAKIRRVIEGQDVTTVFTESLVNPKVAEVLAADLGIETALLDPLESLADPGEDYLSIMRENLAALRGALNCG